MSEWSFLYSAVLRFRAHSLRSSRMRFWRSDWALRIARKSAEAVYRQHCVVGTKSLLHAFSTIAIISWRNSLHYDKALSQCFTSQLKVITIRLVRRRLPYEWRKTATRNKGITTTFNQTYKYKIYQLTSVTNAKGTYTNSKVKNWKCPRYCR